eukprot:6272779-Pyramimonas_sp.AAC.2
MRQGLLTTSCEMRQRRARIDVGAGAHHEQPSLCPLPMAASVDHCPLITPRPNSHIPCMST